MHTTFPFYVAERLIFKLSVKLRSSICFLTLEIRKNKQKYHQQQRPPCLFVIANMKIL